MVSQLPSTTTLTFSGRTLDFADPKPEAIDIIDIARGLGGESRFNSQIVRFYSVAEHSVLVAMRLEEVGRADLALPGLLHDAHEAYTRDVSKPFKEVIGDAYDRAVAPLNRAIAVRFGLPSDVFEAGDAKRVIKKADLHIFEIESAHLQRGMRADRAGERILYDGPEAWTAPWPIGLDADSASALFEMHFRRINERALNAGWLA